MRNAAQRKAGSPGALRAAFRRFRRVDVHSLRLGPPGLPARGDFERQLFHPPGAIQGNPLAAIALAGGWFAAETRGTGIRTAGGGEAVLLLAPSLFRRGGGPAPPHDGPDVNLRRRIMDYMPSTHNASQDIAYGWPCEAAGISVLHAENLGITDAIGEGGLTGLNMLQNLEELWLDGNPGINTLYSIGQPDPLPLTMLSLRGCTEIWGQARPIRFLSTLNFLDMTGCVGYASERFSSTEEMLNGQPLETLNLAGCTYLVSLTDINTLFGLKHLDLSCCWRLTSLQPLLDLHNDLGSAFKNSEATLNVSGIPHDLWHTDFWNHVGQLTTGADGVTKIEDVATCDPAITCPW